MSLSTIFESAEAEWVWIVTPAMLSAFFLAAAIVLVRRSRGTPSKLIFVGAILSFLGAVAEALVIVRSHWLQDYNWTPDSPTGSIVLISAIGAMLGQGVLAFGFLMLVLGLPRSSGATNH